MTGDQERPHRPAAGVARFGLGDDEWEQREMERLHLDYKDELRPPQQFGAAAMDTVSAAVVKHGGNAIFVEGFRPEWSADPERYPGEPARRRRRFSRWYPSLRLLVDVRTEERADFPEQRRRRRMALENGCAYAAVDEVGWSAAGISKAVGYALELLDRRGKA